MKTSTLHEKVETINGFKYIILKSGRRVMFIQARWEVRLHMTPLYRWVSRMFKLVSDHPDYADYEWDQLDWQLFEIESWAKAVREHYEKSRGVARKEYSKRERITALREIAGRTPEEAAMFLDKANQLEKEMVDAPDLGH